MTLFVNAAVVIPRLYVRGMNMASSPAVWGAPSLTALLGLADALQRKHSKSEQIFISSAGIVAHRTESMTNPNWNGSTFNLTRNPLDKDGSTLGIVEEGRANMEFSLVLGLETIDGLRLEPGEADEFAAELRRLLLSMRFSGGSIFPHRPMGRKAWQLKPSFIQFPELGCQGGEEAVREALRGLLPGFALVSRHQTLLNYHAERETNDPKANLIDSWLDFTCRTWRAMPVDGEPTKAEWQLHRPVERGWVVPISPGYVGLGELYAPGEVKAARDSSVPFQFVEPVYSVGEWVAPHRIQDLRSLLWYRHTDPSALLYVCKNDYLSLMEA